MANNRLRILARLFLFWGAVIVLRLLYLQVFNSAEYTRLAHQQQERDVEVQAPRGAIFDSHGSTLAISTFVESVCINPMRTPDPVVAAELLSKILDLDPGVLLGKIAAAVEAKRGFLWIKRKVTPEEAQRLRSFKLDWVEFRQESTRYYPKGPLLAHILGGVDYRESGNSGIELSLNKELSGKPGLMRTKADVRRTVYKSEIASDALPGKDITLSIDERIQYIAERELGAAVEEHRAVTGSLVVMDPNSGQVYAIANYPSYDPNKPPKPGEDIKRRINLAVTAPFEPGSVFKVVTLAAALDSTRLTPGSTYHCGNGSMTLFRRVIHDAKPHGMLSMADILAKSSNIGSIKIALEMGSAKLHEYVRKFGFGQLTGVPLPGESAGIVRKLNRWIPSSIGSVAMGHEISTTTLQLAQACSVIANGGFLVKPVLVLSKRRPDGPLEPAPKPERAPVLRPDNAMKMRMMMEGVVLHGTGKGAKLNGYTSAGKTGSAQIYDYAARVYTHRYNGSFMGFAPVTNPRIVVVVTLNGTQSGSRGFGGIVAAPVFRKVAQAALRLLDVPKDLPDDPDPDSENKDIDGDLADPDLSDPLEILEEEGGNPAVLLAHSGTPGVVMGPEPPPQLVPKGPKTPEFRGKSKRAVLEESSAMGVRVEITGAGIARIQDPPPGVVLRPGDRVRVTFAP